MGLGVYTRSNYIDMDCNKLKNMLYTKVSMNKIFFYLITLHVEVTCWLKIVKNVCLLRYISFILANKKIYNNLTPVYYLKYVNFDT